MILLAHVFVIDLVLLFALPFFVILFDVSVWRVFIFFVFLFISVFRYKKGSLFSEYEQLE